MRKQAGRQELLFSRAYKGGVDLSLVTPMEFRCTLAQLSDWCMRVYLAGNDADLCLADFSPREVRRMVEDRDTPELRRALPFRCPGSKHTPHLGQQKPVDCRPRLCR
jgi:hypothetical protein